MASITRLSYYPSLFFTPWPTCSRPAHRALFNVCFNKLKDTTKINWEILLLLQNPILYFMAGSEDPAVVAIPWTILHLHETLKKNLSIAWWLSFGMFQASLSFCPGTDFRHYNIALQIILQRNQIRVLHSKIRLGQDWCFYIYFIKCFLPHP